MIKVTVSLAIFDFGKGGRNIVLQQVRARWPTGDHVTRRLDRIGLDGGRDQTAGFLILINNSFLFLKRRISYIIIKFLRAH